MISRQEFEEKIKIIDSDPNFSFGMKILWKDGARWAFDVLTRSEAQPKKTLDMKKLFGGAFDGNEMLGDDT